MPTFSKSVRSYFLKTTLAATFAATAACAATPPQGIQPATPTQTPEVTVKVPAAKEFETSANESPVTQAAETQPALDPTCVPFEHDPARAPQKFDEAMTVLVDQLKSYSGWEEIRARMKAANLPLDGICPMADSPPPVEPVPEVRGFAVNVMIKDAMTTTEDGAAPDPKKLAALFREGHLDIIAKTTLEQANSLSLAAGDNAILSDDQDFQTSMLIASVAKAYIESDSIIMAAEAATEDNRETILENYYAQMPHLIAEISDLHAQTIMAHKQNRDLTADERNQFRNKIITFALQDPIARATAANALGQAIASMTSGKMEDDFNNGRPATPPVLKSYNQDEISQKLKTLSGNIADLDAVKNYKTFWADHADQDQAVAVEEFLRKLPDTIREQLSKHTQQQQQNTPQAPRP